jgi:glycosyltransferase involved in cell wall biosynthesis
MHMTSTIESARIRLMTVLTSFQIGGTERQVINIALGLDSSRFELHLACIHRRGELLQEVEALDVPRPMFPIRSLYGWNTLCEAVRLMRYIKSHAIQVVHSYGLYPNLFVIPAAKLAGAPVVIASIRDCGDILTPWQRWFQKLVCRFADCVLVNAESIRDTLVKQGYSAGKIMVIRNGIATSRFDDAAGAASVRAELGLPPTTRLVMVLSRLNHMKGVDYFLQAARMIADSFEDVRFLIVGDGAIKTQLQARADYLGLGSRVIFTGFRTDAPRLLSEVTLSVLPSLSEGLSNTLLESMASGVPVIATRVGGNPEIVEEGVSGLLVAPRDAVGLAKAMRLLLENPVLAGRIGQNGKAKIHEKFSMERSIRDVENLYHKLTQTPDRRLAEAAAQ